MEPDSDFFVAIEAGDLLTAQAMLAADPELVRAFNGDGATALHIAAFRGHRELVDLLCAAGADMNARDNRFGATPAGWALHYLRERGGFLAIEIEDLVYAIKSHDLDWTRRLIERHPRIIATKDANGRPLAEHARESRVPEIIQLFDQPH